jgi:hypothetical protein
MKRVSCPLRVGSRLSRRKTEVVLRMFRDKTTAAVSRQLGGALGQRTECRASSRRTGTRIGTAAIKSHKQPVYVNYVNETLQVKLLES